MTAKRCSCMGVFSIEHSKASYYGDFALYSVAIVALVAYLIAISLQSHGLSTLALTLAGLAGWTLVEYVLHRFVLHGIQPFRAWHTQHHAHPTALICSPTVLSAALITGLVFVPVKLFGSLWAACAVTLGVLIGYLVYAVIHHATHHWRAKTGWLKMRKSHHALHHGHGRKVAYYGVSTTFWDRVFGSVYSP
jgi:sterol desaturase/sphingolipid hydroxylase (fatty acid hydroxylase superfamily)